MTRERLEGGVEGPPVVIIVWSLSIAAAGVGLVLGWNHRRVRKEKGANPMLVAGIALLLAGVGLLAYYDVSTNTMRFQYSFTLTPNAPGTLRVSLPAPVDRSLIANLVSFPSSSSVTLNASGPVASIDVVLSERTTLTASFTRYRYPLPPDLTRASTIDACQLSHLNGCNATIAMFVVSGTVSALQVEAVAWWVFHCEDYRWQLNVTAVPGERQYPAIFVEGAC